MKQFIFATMFSALAFTAMAQDESIHVRTIESQGTEKRAAVEKTSKDQSSVVLKGHEAKQKAASISKLRPQNQNLNIDFTIYDAWVTYLTDLDFDGYYSRFSVEFDADSVFTQADVYARLYLSRGDVFEEYHTTGVFTIFGDSSDDSLVVDSELLSGFPTGDYEMLIELYDAFDDSLVATIDGVSDADLSFLALESQNYETQEPVIIVTEEGGGSFGYLMLLLIPLLMRRTRG